MALTDSLDVALEAQKTDPSLTIVRTAPERALPRAEELTVALGSLAGRLPPGGGRVAVGAALDVELLLLDV
ncbi:hypothetical protein [Streptomyces cyanogenus]|uniref:Uncharacterized protein n=1 Tax=Streptomyces cyanogenus TaxID=80860 RepID=A0ABX7THR5_STRCY|nr:hypothetical protein [Streptomyces cyanogenus]QTD96025.1 hypothetical protein S1361_01640 [Streptomyces cyanogenus]